MWCSSCEVVSSASGKSIGKSKVLEKPSVKGAQNHRTEKVRVWLWHKSL